MESRYNWIDTAHARTWTWPSDSAQINGRSIYNYIGIISPILASYYRCEDLKNDLPRAYFKSNFVLYINFNVYPSYFIFFKNEETLLKCNLYDSKVTGKKKYYFHAFLFSGQIFFFFFIFAL